MRAHLGVTRCRAERSSRRRSGGCRTPSSSRALKDLAARERGATALLVAHLAELDTRDVHLRAGHGSLFAYCRDALALSEQEAYNRIAVARAARRFPLILDLLETGALNLTSVRLLAPRLTPDNHREVLESARGKSKLQVEEIAARLWPKPDVPSFVRKLPAPRSLAAPAAVAPANADAPPVGPLPLGPRRRAPHAFRPWTPAHRWTPWYRRRRCSRSGAFSAAADRRARRDALRVAGPSLRRSGRALGRDHAALAGSLPGSGHHRRRHPREAPSGEGPAPPQPSLGRRSRHPGSGPHCAPRRPRAAEVRGDREATSLGRDRTRVPARPGRGQARGLAARPGALRVRGDGAAGAARSAASWSSITGTPTPWAVRRRSRTSSCGAGPTTTSSRAWISGATAAGRCARTRFRTAPNSFRNEFGRTATVGRQVLPLEAGCAGQPTGSASGSRSRGMGFWLRSARPPAGERRQPIAVAKTTS